MDNNTEKEGFPWGLLIIWLILINAGMWYLLVGQYK